VRILNTSRCRLATPRRIGSPAGPIICSANPTSRATKRVCSTLPLVSADSSVVGMMPWKNSVRPPAFSAVSASLAAESAVALVMLRPLPGWMRLPTTRPMASATVDMTRK
jgi:hypothetical protein